MEEVVKAIHGILPTISKTQLNLIEGRLAEIGIDALENLRYLKSEDFSDIIKIVPARKLISSLQKEYGDNNHSTSSYSGTTEDSPSPSSYTGSWIENSPKTVASGESLDEETQKHQQLNINTNWATSFSIPYHSFPKSFTDDLNNDRRPPERERRQIVRILCSAMQDVCKKPTSKDVHIIASMFVNKNPKSLADIIGGQRVGSGYSSIFSQISERLHNLNRATKSTTVDKSDISDSGLSQEEEQNLSEKKKWLINEYGKSQQNNEKVSLYMNDTYPLQRKLINSGATIEVIQEQFPFLFTKQYISEHFEKLTGTSLENFITCTNKKYSLLHFFRREENDEMRKAISEMDKHINDGYNVYLKLKGVLNLILIFFKENGLMEFYPESTDPKTIQETKRKEGAPVIAVIGNLYTANIFHVVVEDRIVTTLKNCDDAVCLCFGLYYTLNLKYHSKATLTLEFVQRVLIGLNPNNGLKKQKKRRSNIVHPKVLRLANYLDDVDQSY